MVTDSGAARTFKVWLNSKLAYLRIKLLKKKIKPHSKQAFGAYCNDLQYIDRKLEGFSQRIRIKGREMALVWHEKANRTALQTSLLSHTYALLIHTHNMTTVKESAEQCRQL